MEYMPFVGLSPWTIAIQCANLLILALILKRFLFRPVENILEKRKQEVNVVYEEAGRERRRAEMLREEYERKMKNAVRETEKMKLRAEKDIEKRYAEALDRAKGEAAHIRENANRETEKERRHAENQLREQAGDLALEIAEKILEREIDGKDLQRLMDEFAESAEIGK